MDKKLSSCSETYLIYGMHCAACSATINNKFQKTKGVKDVNINLLNKKMRIEYDPTILNDQKIKNIVTRLGYKAEKEAEVSKTTPVLKSYQKRLVVSLIFGILLSFTAMSAMFGLPFMVKFSEFNDGLWFVLIQIILVIPIVITNFSYFSSGFKNLIKLHPNMDSLISLGSVVAIIYSLYNFIGYFLIQNIDHTHHFVIHNFYFETAGMILAIVTLGKYFETRSKEKTNESITKLLELMPLTCNKLENNEVIPMQTSDVLEGDTLIVKAGEVIPLDGVIIEGVTSIDESIITGEAIPVDKTVGDMVTVSSINKFGTIIIRVTNPSGKTWLDKIISLVEEASSTKSPSLRLADKISLYFVPAVMVISLLTFIIWVGSTKDIAAAFKSAVSVLVIACPCSLGLATPTSIMVGMGKSATSGILFKNAESMENLRKTNLIIFDKTGTLTKGKLTVQQISGNDTKKVLSLIASIEVLSSHPIAVSIAEFAKKQNVEFFNVKEFTNVVGSGVTGIINEVKYFIGNADFISKNGFTINDVNDSGLLVIYIASNEGVLGNIVLKDEIKKTSKLAIDELKALNIKTVMCTGDSLSAALKVKEEINLDEVYAKCLPEEKLRIVKKFQSEGYHVTMVGDGINDSVSLKAANLGIGLGAGTDIAKETADIILVKDELLDVVNAINISKQVSRNIKQNLFWALIYNVIAMILATGLYFVITGNPFNPMFGALAMSFSSVCVVTNALRLKRMKIIKYDEEKEIKQMTKILSIEGMMCINCERHVKNALEALPGVLATANKDAKEAVCTLGSTEVTDEQLVKAVENAGYKVLGIK